MSEPIDYEDMEPQGQITMELRTARTEDGALQYAVRTNLPDGMERTTRFKRAATMIHNEMCEQLEEAVL